MKNCLDKKCEPTDENLLNNHYRSSEQPDRFFEKVWSILGWWWDRMTPAEQLAQAESEAWCPLSPEELPYLNSDFIALSVDEKYIWIELLEEGS